MTIYKNKRHIHERYLNHYIHNIYVIGMEGNGLEKIENKMEGNEIRYAPDVNDITTKVGKRLKRLNTNEWVWKDTSEIAKNLEDLTLQDIAPNYKCVTYGNNTTYVIIPKDWAKSISDPDILNAINSLLALPSTELRTVPSYYPDLTQIYEVNDNDWDKVMKRPIGIKWVMSDSEFLNLLEQHKEISD